MGTKIDRRDFLALMGLGGVGAATVGCYQPPLNESWKTWVEPVAGMIPYVPNYFATTTRDASGYGIYAKNVDGRVITVAGNPKHPLNGEKLPGRELTMVQDLYGQQRVKKPVLNGEEVSWEKAMTTLREKLTAAKGKNVSILTGPETGAPQEVLTAFVQAMGSGQVVHFTPFDKSDFAKASELAFGTAAVPYVNLKGADVLVSFGAQFLETWGDVASNSRDFADNRTVGAKPYMKHIQLEGRTSTTGSNADVRLQPKPGSESLLLLAVLKEVAAESANLTDADKQKIATMTASVDMNAAISASGLKASKVEQIVSDLKAAKSGVVLPAETLVLGKNAAHHYTAMLLLNKALGGIGKHFNYDAAKDATKVASHQGLVSLKADLNAGSVDVLFIKDANPVYAVPQLKFADAMGKAGFTVALASTTNETVKKANLVLPVAQELEAWGEINTYVGIDMLQQPVMIPRWEAPQAEDVLIGEIRAQDEAAFGFASFREFLKARWIEKFGAEAADKDAFWRNSLKEGGRFAFEAEGTNRELSANLPDDLFSVIQDETVGDVALLIYPSSRFNDGHEAGRPWLHEMQDPMTGVTWDSVLEINFRHAERLGLGIGDMVNLKVGGETITLPVFLSETIAEHTVAFATGLGHTAFAPENNRGENAFRFLSAELGAGGSFAMGVFKADFSPTGENMRIATFHLPMKGDRINTPVSGVFTKKDIQHKDPDHYNRKLFKGIPLYKAEKKLKGEYDEYAEKKKRDTYVTAYNKPKMKKDSKFPYHDNKDFYPDRSETPVTWGRDEMFYDNYKWEMALDLNRCTGCGSCVVACYAENNIPVVGKDQVIKGREMAWVRLNRYLSYTDVDGETEVGIHFQPMMCQQCGNAPCESVCPSLATYHNKEGLNVMIYNRCVGTRYCANNCSYKVRRFNWFTWEWAGDLNWQLNPGVSQRMKGVMEKCTFCVQRLRDAKDHAKDENRMVRDGEVKTACQEACPSDAILFGNASDKESVVSKAAKDPRAYRAMDGHLQTKPGVSYLKRIWLQEEDH
jgi:molybdopterin-containing oxidoreductase family iron-sulfur binding subunit